MHSELMLLPCSSAIYNRACFPFQMSQKWKWPSISQDHVTLSSLIHSSHPAFSYLIISHPRPTSTWLHEKYQVKCITAETIWKQSVAYRNSYRSGTINTKWPPTLFTVIVIVIDPVPSIPSDLQHLLLHITVIDINRIPSINNKWLPPSF